MKQRNEYFDFLRGIAIIAVIAIHTFVVTFPDTTYLKMQLLCRQITLCAVPTFLFISGYFMANKDLTSLDKYKRFIMSQGARVYIPMLFWSLPYILIHILTGGVIWKGVVLWICGGFSIYYFIALILQYYIALPILQRFADLRGLMISLTITLSSVSILCYLFFIQKIQIPLILYAGPATGSVIFFHMGIYLKKLESNLLKYNTYKTMFNKYIYIWLLICALLVFLQYVETMCIISYMGQAVGTGIKYTWVLYACTMIVVLWSLQSYYKSNIVTNVFAKIGRISFGIYLTHMLIMIVMHKLFPILFNVEFLTT